MSSPLQDLHRSLDGHFAEAERSWKATSRFGPPGRLARSALRRLTRPLTARQRLVDEALSGALRQLSALSPLDPMSLEALRADHTVVAETDVGRLLLHADDKVMTPLIQRDGHWELPEATLLRETIRPGSVVLDVGANVGYMTALAARMAGSEGLVVAVEPEPANVALLRANLWLNGLENVRVLPIAAWSARDMLPLRLNADNRGDHRVGVAAGAEPLRLVPAAPLDDLLGNLVVDVVKVDTQGSEHEAILGLRATLSRSPDAVILAEFWLDGPAERGIAPRDVLRTYRDAGFAISLLGEDGRPSPTSDDGVIAACESCDGRFVNLVLRRAI